MYLLVPEVPQKKYFLNSKYQYYHSGVSVVIFLTVAIEYGAHRKSEYVATTVLSHVTL